MSHPFRILDPHEKEAGTQEFAGRCALVVMAKAPVPGKVKTRLSPPLTSTDAALLNAEFLRDTLANLSTASASCSGIPVVSYTPTGQEDAFRGILPDSALLLPQRGDGFGERLLTTATDLFACGFSAVCLIDSDSPTAPTQEFVRAAEVLLAPAGDIARRMVLGRSEDGGYYLLGITRPHARLFADITWSTGVVAAQTEERARELRLETTLLATWYDVDDAASLAQLRRELGGIPRTPQGYAAPCTRRFLATLASEEEEADAANDMEAGVHGRP